MKHTGDKIHFGWWNQQPGQLDICGTTVDTIFVESDQQGVMVHWKSMVARFRLTEDFDNDSRVERVIGWTLAVKPVRGQGKGWER